jgi:hypothetical protein
LTFAELEKAGHCSAMAQVFPSDPANAGSAASETLVWTLRTLPDPWTLLRDRRIDASGELIDLVLVHPEIGVALINEAPRHPTAGVAALRDLLEREQFADFFPGTLPVVSLSVAINDLATLDQRLSRVFDASPLLAIEDRDWADALIELLSLPTRFAIAEDAACAEVSDLPPVMPGFAGRRESLAFDIGPPPHAIEEAVAAPVGRTRAREGRTTRRRRVTLGALAVCTASVLAAAAAALALRSSAMPNDATPPPVQTAALVAPAAVAAPLAATANASPPRSSAPARYPRRVAVRHVRCADWLHQSRPGGSDYHGPPVAGCRPSR